MLRQFFRYFWGMIVRPAATIEALRAEPSVRWALLAACLPVLQVWGNVALNAAFGQDWLGTRPYLEEPTFVAGFGRLRVGLEHWVGIFAALMPLLGLLDLTIYTGTAHLFSKLWRGQGTFEQLLNTLTLATVVPNIVVAGVSEWLFSVPADLISGHPHFWEAAMRGELGPTMAVIWNAFTFVIYLGLQWGWMIVLGSMAIRRVQGIPRAAAVGIMLVTFAVAMFVSSLFVR